MSNIQDIDESDEKSNFKVELNDKTLPEFTFQAYPLTVTCPHCCFKGKTIVEQKFSQIQHIMCILI